MCGISGFVQQGLGAEQWTSLLKAMARSLAHRGPDGEAVWFDSAAGIGFGHRRLAVIDLSEHGRQPMRSHDGRWILSFNGEIYNFRELRQELRDLGEGFSGHCDTEVLLAAIRHWGPRGAVRRLNGMFAFAAWDRTEGTLYLARDRMGEKPLYYGHLGTAFAFASELKALRRHPAFAGEIDRDALALYLEASCVPAPYTIYRGLYKLPPACLLTLGVGEGATEPIIEEYWSLRQAAEEGVAAPFAGSASEAVELLEDAIKEAVQLRMVADVPLGAFLSGGVDSSAVVALMQAASSRPVQTFSIGFHIPGYNEAPYAGKVAQHLGTDHCELYVSADEAREVIPLLPGLYDEPFADPSQIPTYLVSQLARRQVTVALSGDGGDELFWGYSRYPMARELWRKVRWLPPVVRRTAAAGLEAVPLRALDLTFGWASPFLARYGRRGSAGDKLRKLTPLVRLPSGDAMYRHLVTHWRCARELVPGAHELPTVFTDGRGQTDLPSLAHRMPYLDQRSYLPDDILVKVDRASMAVSLEVRVPLLDHRLVELAWRLPLALKWRDGQGKWILRQVLQRYVPAKLVERPKMGFGVPIGAWLRGPLRPWAEELLAEERLRREGLLSPEPIRIKWSEHLAERGNWQYHLWDVLMFQAWLEAHGTS